MGRAGGRQQGEGVQGAGREAGGISDSEGCQRSAAHPGSGGPQRGPQPSCPDQGPDRARSHCQRRRQRHPRCPGLCFSTRLTPHQPLSSPGTHGRTRMDDVVHHIMGVLELCIDPQSQWSLQSMRLPAFAGFACKQAMRVCSSTVSSEFLISACGHISNYWMILHFDSCVSALS